MRAAGAQNPFPLPRARPRPGLSRRMKRQARGEKKKQCKCAPRQIIYKALFLVAFNPLGLSGRLQPHSPGRGNDRHYYPAQNTGAARGGWGRCCLASSKIWELNFQGEIEDTGERSGYVQKAHRTPSSIPSWPARPSPIHSHWAQTRSVGVSSVPRRLEK